MCHCITPQALLSALVGRAQREGKNPTRAEVQAVLDVGCSREEILVRFETVGDAASLHVRELLAAIAA